MFDNMNDAIETGVTLKLFKNKAEGKKIFKTFSVIKKIPITKFEKNKIINFNSNRIKNIKDAYDAYPENDRPRGIADIKSVNHHIRRLKGGKKLYVYLFATKKNDYILLDGAHRIVATKLCVYI